MFFCIFFLICRYSEWRLCWIWLVRCIHLSTNERVIEKDMGLFKAVLNAAVIWLLVDTTTTFVGKVISSQSHAHCWFENGPSISQHNWRSILKSVVSLFIRIHIYIQYILNNKNCNEIFEWDTYAIDTLFNFCSTKLICLITFVWFVCTYEHNFCHVCV